MFNMKIIIECKICDNGIVYPINPNEGASSCHECEGVGKIYVPVTGYETLEQVREDYPNAVIQS